MNPHVPESSKENKTLVSTLYKPKPKNMTFTKTLWRKERQKIYASLTILGPLQHAGGALIDQVYELSSESYFEPTGSVGHEWKLMPKRWVAFQFSSGRGYAPKIHISLDAFPTTLEGTTPLIVKQGRIPRWCKVTVTSISELEHALHLVKEVFKISG